MRSANAGKFIEMLADAELDFDLFASNYTMKIVVNGTNVNFIKNNQSNMVFAAYRKLQSDLSKFKVPDIAAEEVNYFIHDFKNEIYSDHVFNIDLKSAYANILFMDNLISLETFKYLTKLQKQDRLAAVGMLASRKEIFHFKNGQPETVENKRSEFSGFFFYAVKRTSEIMGELKKICGNDYLFTWVDGIYFHPVDKIMNECREYLKEIKFPFSYESLFEFDVKMMPRYVDVTFKKDGKLKQFALPVQDGQFRKIISDSLINSKYKTNEKNKSKNSGKQSK